MGSLFRIALRNVARNRRRSAITFSAVFLSVGIMVGLRGFLNGLQSALFQSVVFGQTGALEVHRKGFAASGDASLDLSVPADAAFMAKLTAVPGVKAAAARLSFGGIASNGDTTTFARFLGIDPKRELDVCPQRMEMVSSGIELGEALPTAAIFTPELSRSLHLRLGQKATLIATDRDGVLNALDVDLTGTYGQPGLPLPEKKVLFLPIALARELVRMDGRATEIALSVEDLGQVEGVQSRLRAVVGPDYEVSTWHEVAPFVDQLMAKQDFILRLILGLFLFLSLFGIANTTLLTVSERTREIGTLLALGVRRRHVLSLFLAEAVLLGLSGGAFGAAVGSVLVRYLGARGVVLQFAGIPRPVHVYPWVGAGYVCGLLALSTAGAALAAFLPSRRASRLRPALALTSV